TSIKNNDDSVQPDILSKQFKAFKFNQKKFTAKKDILSMECISGKQTTQPSDLSSSLQSNQLENKISNFDDHRHLPTSPSSSTSWGGRSKYSYYSPRSKPIMERNVDYPSYSSHYYRRSIIKPRPYRKIRPYDNRYHRVFPPFRSEIKSFNPTYSHKVWKNDYTYPKFSDSSPKFSDPSSKFSDPPPKFSDPSSKFSDSSPKFSDRYLRDRDSTSVGDSSTQHTDRFSSSSSSFINNLPNSESTLPESSHQSSNNHNLISVPKSRSGTDIDPMELDNSQQNTTPAATSISSTTLTNPSTTSNNNTDKKQFSLDISSFIPSEAMSLLDDKMSINGDNGDNGLNTIQKNSMENKFTKNLPPIDDYRVHKPGSFIPARRHSYFPRDKYKNVGTRFYDEHNRRFNNNDHPIHYHENYQRDIDYQRNPRYHQRNIDYLRDDKPLRSDSYDSNFNNEKRVNIQQDYPLRNNRHDSHHMTSDIKGNFEINRYHHSQIHRVYNP
ncbi:2823_t:CDS:2, partial [Dentiscutata heterogama]